MHPSDPPLNVGDLVVLRADAAQPPHSHIAPGTAGRVLFVDDADASAVTVQFVNSGRPVRLRRADLMGLAPSEPAARPAPDVGALDAPLAPGDLVEILAVTARPTGQPAAPRRYGRVLEIEDEDGRVAVQVEGRQHPLHLPLGQLRRVEHRGR
jgi:hypothetical protein